MSKVATEADAGENSGQEHNPGITGDFRAHIRRITTEERFATWTETLGYESCNDRVESIGRRETEELETWSWTQTLGYESCDDRVVSSDRREETEEGRIYQSPTAGAGTGSWRRKSTCLDTSNFPPLLSVLNENGRSAFNFIKRGDNGRLQMRMVRSERPEIVALQTPPMRIEKRLKMLLIKFDDARNHDHADHVHREAAVIE